LGRDAKALEYAATYRDKNRNNPEWIERRRAHDKKKCVVHAEKIAERKKQYVEKNRDKVDAYQRAYALRHSARKTEAHRQWRQKNAERHRKVKEARYAKNREQILAARKLPEAREARREKERARRISDPQFVLDDRMSVNIRLALKRMKAGRSWESIVGYTLADLVSHLERQFAKGMCWANIGEWHIDHIRPRSSFQYTSDADPQFKACWSLANLQPLWAADNLKKHAKILTLV
jgi:hypothetical protein